MCSRRFRTLAHHTDRRQLKSALNQLDQHGGPSASPAANPRLQPTKQALLERGRPAVYRLPCTLSRRAPGTCAGGARSGAVCTGRSSGRRARARRARGAAALTRGSQSPPPAGSCRGRRRSGAPAARSHAACGRAWRSQALCSHMATASNKQTPSRLMPRPASQRRPRRAQPRGFRRARRSQALCSHLASNKEALRFEAL